MKKKRGKIKRWSSIKRFLRRWFVRLLALIFALIVCAKFINLPMTPYMIQQRFAVGHIEQHWVSGEDIAPVMLRSAVAAEDARFCQHWGFDVTAIRAALASGSNRGASTISQQVVKNVYLWQGRSWLRKSIEAFMTPAVELVWSKQRILEVYLNVAEFDEGVFGVEAAARHYFGISAKDLNAVQAARLAMVLPNPKGRDAGAPTTNQRRRSAQILDGAQTLYNTNRDRCFAY